MSQQTINMVRKKYFRWQIFCETEVKGEDHAYLHYILGIQSYKYTLEAKG